jgi:outer membrane protein
MRKLTYIILLLLGTYIPLKKVWSLQDCLNYAVANNITVKKAALTKTTDQLNYEQAKTTNFLRYGSASMGLTNGSSIDPITSSFVNQTILSNSFGVSGNITLYQGIN